MSIANYATHVIAYIQRNHGGAAQPDPRGNTFLGGILMDLGDGKRVAFLLPSDDMIAARRSLVGHLEDIYPAGHQITDFLEDGPVTAIYVKIADAALPLAG